MSCNRLPTRRGFIKLLPAAISTGAAQTSASPLVLVMVPQIVQVVFDFFRARREEDAQFRLSRAGLHNQVMQTSLASGNIHAAMLARREALAELGQLSPNIDGASTRVGVGRGMLWVDSARHGSGYLTPDEAELAAAMLAQGEACLVPEAPTYMSIDKSDAPMLTKALAKASGTTPPHFLQSNTPVQWRPISIGGQRGSAVIAAANQLVGNRRATRTFLV